MFDTKYGYYMGIALITNGTLLICCVIVAFTAYHIQLSRQKIGTPVVGDAIEAEELLLKAKYAGGLDTSDPSHPDVWEEDGIRFRTLSGYKPKRPESKIKLPEVD